jgi:hypothetical protein
MAQNETNLKKGTKVFVGNVAVTLKEDAAVVFESLVTRDEVAEALAHKPEVYAAHRDSLAHEEVAVRDGAQVRVAVSYGIGGSRVERILGPVEAADGSGGEEPAPSDDSAAVN